MKLRGIAEDRLDRMRSLIFQAFNNATMKEGYLCLWLANLMKPICSEGKERLEVANKMKSLAYEFDSQGELSHSREYFCGAQEWYKKNNEINKVAEISCKIAESWIKEATLKLSSNYPSYSLAATCYENAIQFYRSIPRKYRVSLHIDDLIVETKKMLSSSGERAIEEMSEINTPGIDISDIIERARTCVTGKSPQDALVAFANLHPVIKKEELQERIVTRMRKTPLSYLISASFISRDGRTIARRPSVDFNDKDGNEVAIRESMVREYNIHVGLMTQGNILPALEVIQYEHRLREADFIGLASQSPIVPKDRAAIFGKALFSGYEMDFITAIHLLVPQIENMVRVHLKQAGVITTRLDSSGIQTENGLGALLELPEIEQVFGKDLVFEMRALFCDPFGSNLRNELAHGLADEYDCNSMYSVYSWWLSLKLVVNVWWNFAHVDKKENNKPTSWVGKMGSQVD